MQKWKTHNKKRTKLRTIFLKQKVYNLMHTYTGLRKNQKHNKIEQ